MINVNLENIERYFCNSDQFRTSLYRIASKLSNIEINNDEISHDELTSVYNDIDKLVDLFGNPHSLKDVNPELNSSYNKNHDSVNIFMGAFDIEISKNSDMKYYYINSFTYNELNIVANNTSIIELNFTDKSVKPDIESVTYEFLKRSNELSKLGKDQFKSAFVDLMNIFHIFGNALEEYQLIESLGAVYYTRYHAKEMHCGSLDCIHISRGYIDIDIYRKHNTRNPHYYIDTIIINRERYPEVNFVTDSIKDFMNKIKVTNGCLDKYIKKSPLSEFKNVNF